MFSSLIECDDWCRHGYHFDDCDECNDDCMDIDKCLNCGRYKSGSQLDKWQCCIKGCVNPNEY